MQIVFYSPIENSRARVAFQAVNFLIFVFKVHNVVGFGLQPTRLSTKTIRLLALVFYEQ